MLYHLIYLGDCGLKQDGKGCFILLHELCFGFVETFEDYKDPLNSMPKTTCKHTVCPESHTMQIVTSTLLMFSLKIKLQFHIVLFEEDN